MQGHAQIPIINADKKLVGMVYQSEQLAKRLKVG
jgi:CBS-domain-containing membrane protein